MPFGGFDSNTCLIITLIKTFKVKIILQLGKVNYRQQMTPLYLEIIGKPFWNHFFHGKGSLASGGPVVIMADSST